jgi:hypothetical protein
MTTNANIAMNRRNTLYLMVIVSRQNKASGIGNLGGGGAAK